MIHEASYIISGDEFLHVRLQDRVKLRLEHSTRRPSAPTEELQEGGAGHDETLLRTGKSVC